MKIINCTIGSKQRVNTCLLLMCICISFHSQIFAQNEIPVTGLMNPAEVLYPDTSVPTIKAQSMTDMAFMYGYIQARDRMFQIDFTRRLAHGTLSELVGVGAIDTDIQLRTIGLARAAFRSYQAATTQTKAILQSYANGVNAWIDANSNNLPVEYAPLEISIVKHWSAIDSLAILKFLMFQISNDFQEIDWTVAIGTMQQVGAATGFDGTTLFLEDLNRFAPPDNKISIPNFLQSIGGLMLDKNIKKIDAKKFTQYSQIDINLAKSIANNWSATEELNKIKNDDNKERGSNMWAISGTHTESGYPIVANDPHFALSYPSAFYPVHVYVENDAQEVELNAAGVGFPGTPFIAQGCNQTICWGSTVHPVDETDFFFEDIRTNLFGLPAFTVFKGKEEPIKYIFQVYYANQVGDGIQNNLENQHIGYDAGGITYIVKRRNHGPILSVDPVNNRAVTMQFTGFSATQEAQAFIDMSQAIDIHDFRQAITSFDVGSQNFAVADVFGNIAYYTGAEVPIREDLQTLNAPDGVPPMFIRDGTGVHMNEWMTVSNPQVNQAEPHEIIPEAEMPFWENPDQGWFANSNNDPIGVSLDNNVLNQLRPDGGLYYISQGVFPAYRMGRITSLIESALAKGKVSATDSKEWQSNTQSMDAQLIVPHILNAFTNASSDDAWTGLQQFALDSRISESIQLFNTWDFSMPSGVIEGYNYGENPFALIPPSDEEINYSVATTLYSLWRSMVIKNTIDATFDGIDTSIGQEALTPLLSSGRSSFNAFKNLLDNYDQRHGYGASGVDFFAGTNAPTREDALDYIILLSLKQTLDLLASDEFATAFSNSNDIMDYRWGKLHRVIFAHPLGESLSLPNGLFGLSTIDGLTGIIRPGGYEVLDAAGHNVRANSLNDFMFDAGAVRRFIATMTTNGPQIEQVLPGGQSGDIRTGPFYVNQLFSWLVNSYLPLFLDVDLIDSIAILREFYSPQ